MQTASKTVARAVASDIVFFECDIQFKLEKHIIGFASIAHNAGRIAQAAKIMDIPVIATRQKNFGDISPVITKHHHEGVKVFEKKTFSMLDDDVNTYFTSLNRK